MNKGFGSSGSGGQNAIQRTLMAAVEHIQAGRLDEAAAALLSGGAAKNPVGRNILGDIRLKQGRPRDALREFDAALAMVHSFPEAHSNRGVALQELGRLADALAAEDRALSYRSDYVTAHFNRGNILKDLGRSDDAIAAYDRALKGQPAFPEALVNRGMALLDKGEALDAQKDFRRAVTLRPDYIAAHVGTATAYQRLGQVSEALVAIDAALAIDPENRDALLAQGAILNSAGRYADALAVADRLLARNADDGAAHVARSGALWRLKRLDEALAAADTAVRVAPKAHESHTARGIILGELGRFDEVWPVLDTASRLGADGFNFHRTRAVALSEAGRVEQALAAYGQALAAEPHNPLGHHYRSFALLALGDFEEGWAEHEWRLRHTEFSRPEMLKVAPLWKGEDLAGKKVLLYSEQGHGDAIQFVRYAPLVAARGGQVTLLVHGALRRLFAANFPDMDVTDNMAMRSGFDYQAPLMSLAHILGTTDESLIPRDMPYLVADDERIAKWRARLGDNGFKVGISWQGNPEYPNDRLRSIPLARYAPLAAVPDVRLISLQSFIGLDQLANLPEGMKVETLGEEIVNNPDGFREVAAVMANLDLMIMSDTGPAHLAGALGRPVWVALRERPDWRWMVERSDSPWYPTMRLFRQKTPGDWDGVFTEIAAALADEMAGRAAE